MCTGESIKEYIERIGMTQKHLSEKKQIPVPKLNLALNGNRKITFNEYALICWALDVSPDKFITPHPPA